MKITLSIDINNSSSANTCIERRNCTTH